MSKYHAKRCEYGGHKFDSMAEMRHYQELELRERAGEIVGLEVHPRYPLYVVTPSTAGDCPWVKVADYVADFRYQDGYGEVVEDVKGVRTQLYKLKKRMWEAQYGRKITEVEA